MDPITLIVTALAAGASAGVIDALKDNAKDAAKAAYAKLRGLVRTRVAGTPAPSWRWPSTRLTRRTGRHRSRPS